MKSFIAPALLSLALSTMGDAASVSTKGSLVRRADFCDQWGTATTDDYILYNNLWGQDDDPSGTQCTGLDSVDGNKIAWHTSWSWAGTAWQVKSYANAKLQFTPKTLSAVTSIKSAWEWSYSSTDVVADVAYDMFLSSTPDGSEEYEIMVWLAAMGGAGAISSTGQPIATVTISGIEWDVYVGPNGAMTVYSFVAKAAVTSYSGDLLDFFTYLEKDQALKDSLYLIAVQAGTEPFTGKADMTVSSYSVAVV
ncbi:Glycoside hydrolase family 12 [Penicillium fimorum]|uniref:xyloglucan-specific endo-beta-1,4-glucanase n=1 Tax=Penicillium fimorum TaxID=1882269 RepID=A0A9W9XU86_9EURO|nr:Glycoside hydrolase family 12 [Penicillium fimorum]